MASNNLNSNDNATESTTNNCWRGQDGERKGDDLDSPVSPLSPTSTDSQDGFLRHVSRNSSRDLNNFSAGGNVTPDKEHLERAQGRPMVPGISLLAGKYLLVPDLNGRIGSYPKTEPTPCISIQTKEHFICKVVQRNSHGLAMLAAYHRLDSSDYVNEVIEAILTPKVLYLIMPKNYGNVHSYVLEKRILEEAEAANLFKQMVEIVKHCHAKGIILRDVKLGRFVFMDQAKTKLKLDSLEESTLLLDSNDDKLLDRQGCPNYVSPEKAETLRTNARYPGKASDVWCLAICLYTMLTGRYPFNDSNHVKLLNKIRSGNYILPPGLSTSVSFLLKTLLKKSPFERPTCSEILRSPWIVKHCILTQRNISSEIEPDSSAMEDSVQQTSLKSDVSDQVVPC